MSGKRPRRVTARSFEADGTIPTVTALCFAAPRGVDVVLIVRRFADLDSEIELISVDSRARWFSLRQNVFVAVRGSERAIARLCDVVDEAIFESIIVL
jgi:hypothetical protein